MAMVTMSMEEYESLRNKVELDEAYEKLEKMEQIINMILPYFYDEQMKKELIRQGFEILRAENYPNDSLHTLERYLGSV
ncbi:hypothetical protein LCM23_14615 [Cytobacillus kochii]|uniref:hypothetical protein n=1 Tax=Cytobacillus kochii TaxID=859143 RepID=UPI001CD79AE4|nr:hypothetical protein [Cytobacillus kochii]MCA1027330.1 hypothetical protein [Cytobacillus kochii]